MPKVYVVNKSSHDFSSATKYGNLIFMTEGRMNKYGTNDMVRKFKDALRNSNPEDYIVQCSLSVMNSLACTIFALKHKKLNLLLYKNGEYIERNHVFKE